MGLLTLSGMDKRRDVGLLIVRLVVGMAFVVVHGFKKISAGPEMWTGLGGAMQNLGIGFMPVFWGFMAALAEFGGGIFLTLGLFTRWASIIMAFNMFVALMMHYSNGDPLSKIAHPAELCALFLALFFLGAGKYSVDNLIGNK